MCTLFLSPSSISLAIPVFQRYFSYMTDHIDLVLRWILGGQLIFWGLNGFFHWRPVPPSPPALDRFVTACFETRFIMPTVKIFEIVFGLFLVLNFATPLALVMLAPIVFVITGLHLLLNTKKAWEVVLPITVPFFVLVGLHYDAWLRLL